MVDTRNGIQKQDFELNRFLVDKKGAFTEKAVDAEEELTEAEVITEEKYMLE